MNPGIVLGVFGIIAYAFYRMSDSLAVTHASMPEMPKADDVNDTLGVTDNPMGDSWLSPVHENFGVISMSIKRISAKGISLLQDFEGFSATAYWDHKGYSIGYGHLIRSGDGLTKDSVIDRAKAGELLSFDIGDAEDAVNDSVSVELTQSQFDALVSLCYNIGTGAFKKSTLVRKLNNGDFDGAANEFPRWNKASGRINNSLVSRRATEQDLFVA
jgi:lysozyme